MGKIIKLYSMFDILNEKVVNRQEIISEISSIEISEQIANLEEAIKSLDLQLKTLQNDLKEVLTLESKLNEKSVKK